MRKGEVLTFSIMEECWTSIGRAMKTIAMAEAVRAILIGSKPSHVCMKIGFSIIHKICCTSIWRHAGTSCVSVLFFVYRRGKLASKYQSECTMDVGNQ